jgi:Protein of unknown function (DUF2752)
MLRRYFELAFWSAALILLGLMPPDTDTHYSFCLFRLIGIKFCPGCGLGHSISYLFHGNINQSLSSHPLGIFAVITILSRILKLIRTGIPFKKMTDYAR